MTMNILTIHPFPARMAPEIALAEAACLKRGAVVLDSMSGSGTVVRHASERGLQAIGCDLDPLAILMAQVWTTPIDTKAFVDYAGLALNEAKALRGTEFALDWIDSDKETKEFVQFWFAKSQERDLRAISKVLSTRHGPLANALKIAVSRIIITKGNGASLAADTSHSRPHRVRTTNDFDVFSNIERSVHVLTTRLSRQPPPGNVSICQADARNMAHIESDAVDSVITSPPYLNAIDYMRGHKMSLVWLGYRCSDLRSVRGNSVGAERGAGHMCDTERDSIVSSMTDTSLLPKREKSFVDRYVDDIIKFTKENYRVIKPGGSAVFVIGDSCLKGVFIRNSAAIQSACINAGFTLVSRLERDIPPSNRYLPPPKLRTTPAENDSSLAKRMRSEVVLKFAKPNLMN